MSTTETAADAATEIVQSVAKPIAFLATLAASAVAVAWGVRWLGRRLPMPDYAAQFFGGDDQDQENDE